MPGASRIANYQPEELLASAGCVDTFRAQAKHLSTAVALKVFFLDRAGGEAGKPAAERFLAAGRRAMEVRVAGAVRVLDVSDDPAAAFVASELVPGLDLARLVDGAGKRGGATAAPLEPVLASLICLEVARTLAAAHALTLPHLGLGPGNVIVAPTGKVTVTDFGLSAWLHGQVPGPADKFSFMAPELRAAAGASLSPEAAVAADLYALGRLLRFLLARPGSTTGETSSMDGVPKPLLAVLHALTAAAVKDRPDTAKTVVAWLADGLGSEADQRSQMGSRLAALGLAPEARPGPRAAAGKRPPPQALPVLRTGTAAKQSPRSRPHARILVGAAVVVAGAVAAWGLSKPPTADPTPPSRSDLPTPSGGLRLSQVEIPVVTPDGGLALEPRIQAGDRVYVPGPKQRLPRVPEHLFLATNPDQADVWVDGVLKGKTPVDLAIGTGGHRVVAIKAGYRMLRAVYDTTEGEYIHKDLQRAAPPRAGDGLLDVDCRERNRYPLFLDDEETGLLCPASKLPVPSGRHSVGIFVPLKRTVVTVEVNVPPGRQPVRVTLGD